MDEMPPGYRFYPTEEELICFYLHKKLQSSSSSPHHHLNRVIPLLHIYDFNPWDLPQYAGELCHGDPEQWFFFNPRQEKEARGGRPNRLTTTGYWKATGSPSYVYSKDSRVIGLKRTMVFYKGRAPLGKKTQWKMNEYRAIQFPDQQQNINAMPSSSSSPSPSPSPSSSAAPKLRQEVSLCRVYIRSKCMRAFDRRPSAEPNVIGETSTTREAHGTTITPASTSTFTSHNHDHQQLNHNQNMTLTTEIITSSRDSTSSSGGEAAPMEADDAAAVNSTDPRWDLDQLDWFLNSID